MIAAAEPEVELKIQNIAVKTKVAPMPSAKVANPALNCIKKSAITELKGLNSPPLPVMLVVKAVSLLISKDEAMNWADCRKELNKNFLDKLLKFNPNDVSAKNM